ncbi:MAG: radical SAM protein [Oligoflexia bacterium]|nr:radical SAM protein [Oligoflexia bacterium]
MKKIILINYSGYQFTTNTFIPDNSLAVLAALLSQHAFPVEVLDLHNMHDMKLIAKNFHQSSAEELYSSIQQQRPFDQHHLNRYKESIDQAETLYMESIFSKIIDKIKHEDVQYIGFKLWMGRGLTSIITLATQIKKSFPHITLIGGGPALQYMQHHFSKLCNLFDHLLYGEGEYAFLKILGISAPPFHSSHLDHFPPPLYSKEIFSNLHHFHKMRIIDDSRGCFNDCAFCSHSHLIGKNVRTRQPRRIVDQMQKMAYEEGITFFRFSGSNTPWHLVTAIGEEILSRNLKINYSIFSSLNNANAKDFPMLSHSGLRSIFFGVESGDAYLLKVIHQKSNISNAHTIKLIQAAMEAQIFACLSLIYPSPFEDSNSTQNSLQLLQQIFKHQKLGSVLVMPPFLSPGSRWWSEMAQFGFAFIDGVDQQQYILNMATKCYDYFFIEDSIANMGYTLNSKSMSTLMSECAHFIKTLTTDHGISTNLSETTYMLSQLYDLPAATFTATTTYSLLTGK